MSGPKHSTFDVRENKLRRQRERAAALAEIVNLGRDLESILIQLADLNPDKALLLQNEFTELRRLADGINHTQVCALPGQMRVLLDRASGVLGCSKVQRQRQDALVSQLSQGSDEIVRNEANRTAKKLAERDRWLVPLIEKLGELKHQATSKELERIQRVEALATDVTQARESLKFDAMAIQLTIEERIASGRVAAELRIRLAGHSDPLASAVTRDLLKVEAGNVKMTSELRSRADREIERLEKNEDRMFVAQVLADGFRELGYVVDESFTTAFARGEALEIGRPGDRPYAAQLKFDPNRLEVDSELVVVEDRPYLTAEAIAHDDKNAEQSWCGDLAKVLSAARSKGIHGTAKPNRRIGAAPARSIATKQAGRSGRDAGIGQQQIARTLKP